MVAVTDPRSALLYCIPTLQLGATIALPPKDRMYIMSDSSANLESRLVLS